MKNYLQRGADGFDFATYDEAMRALQRLRAKAQDDDLEVVLSYIVRALQVIVEKLPDGGR